MKRNVRLTILVLGTCLLLLTGYVSGHAQDESLFITKDRLKSLLGGNDMTLIDLRFGRDWNDAALKIKGAVREDPMKPGQWIDKYSKDKLLVFYCA